MGDRVLKWLVAIVFVLLSVIHILAWQEFLSPVPIPDELERRQFAAEAMSSSVTAGITAVSILIPASLLVIELSKGQAGAGIPAMALVQVFRGTWWLLGSLFLGLTALYLVPTRAQLYDVTRDARIGWLYGPQLLALFAGILFIVVGLKQAFSAAHVGASRADE